MPNINQQGGFFSGSSGMSPEDTEALLDAELRKNRGGVGAALAKQGIGFNTENVVNNFAGDPRMIRALKIKDLQQKVGEKAQELGMDISDPEKYSKLVFSTAIENNMPDVAFEAIKLGRDMELDRRKVEADEERNRVLDDYYKTVGKNKGKDKKKFVLPNTTDVKNIQATLSGREDLAGMEPKQMANLAIRMAACIKELKNDYPDVEFGDAFDAAYQEFSDKIKPAKKRGPYDTDFASSNWKDIINPFDEKASYDDSGDPITSKDVEESAPAKIKPLVKKGTRIVVIDKNGKEFTIPSEQVEQAKKQGYKVKQ